MSFSESPPNDVFTLDTEYIIPDSYTDYKIPIYRNNDIVPFGIINTIYRNDDRGIQITLGKFNDIEIVCKKIIVCYMSDVEKTRVRREILSLLILQDHPNILKIIALQEKPNYISIFTEYCTEGDLRTYFNKYLSSLDIREREEKFIPLFNQILVGLKFMHSHNICHRDIKAENIFLLKEGENLTAKISDFGFSAPMGSILKSAVGTLIYVAPEILLGAVYDGEKIDSYSLGVVLYTMVHGMFPFNNYTNNRQLLDEMQEIIYISSRLNVETRYMLQGLLTFNPDERLLISKCIRLNSVQILLKRSTSSIDYKSSPRSSRENIASSRRTSTSPDDDLSITPRSVTPRDEDHENNPAGVTLYTEEHTSKLSILQKIKSKLKI